MGSPLNILSPVSWGVILLISMFGFDVRTLHAGGSDWDSPTLWTIETDNESSLTLQPTKGIDGVRLDLNFTLQGPGHRWVQISRDWDETDFEGRPLTFLFRADSGATLEVKIQDQDGSVFLCRYPLTQYSSKWEPVVLYPESFEYGWGGDGDLNRPIRLSLAVAGTAEVGTLSMDEIGPGRPGMMATPIPDGPRLDPARNKKGFGFTARRDKRALPEDPLVYEWLKTIQDTGSFEQQLLSSMEDNRAQTFNNALAAIVFILKDDRDRAARILDFYSRATDELNLDASRQNFFVKGEPRGFYQDMYLKDSAEGSAFLAPHGSDRWMGDMAWLLIAAHYYGQRYGPDRYATLKNLLRDLLVSFYQPASPGGYIRHGWRRSDTALHESSGHPEGNLDCYAALKLVGEKTIPRDIRTWLHSVLVGSRLPLDLYSWQVLALGSSYANALGIPESDFRYRKTLRVNGRRVMGFFHSARTDVQNIWADGVGQMACAYYVSGKEDRANFYSNQLDALLIDRKIKGQTTRAIPYAPNKEGGLDWVRQDRGFTSTAAWYIFAKNRFNPFTLQTIPKNR
ncbi:MAG: hypothetical protein JNK54_03975 [Elusimicrobia bacterium]|nr:hypothetical protein [Elusimicrobiota bacterium]